MCFREEEEKAVTRQMWCLALSLLRCGEQFSFKMFLLTAIQRHNKILSCCYIRICVKTLTISYCSAFFSLIQVMTFVNNLFFFLFGYSV